MYLKIGFMVTLLLNAQCVTLHSGVFLSVLFQRRRVPLVFFFGVFRHICQYVVLSDADRLFVKLFLNLLNFTKILLILVPVYSFCDEC
mgnify:CR=1 FL=1